LKVVIDTNVLVSGLLNPDGIPGQVMNLLLFGRIQALYDIRIMAEYREVLLRPKFGFEPADIETLLSFIRGSGMPVVPEQSKTFFRDDADRKFYEIAIAGGTEFLITGNTVHFPSSTKKIYIVTPRRFLEVYLSGTR
jgi:putative PIN family toxin of toxin-antitoxin system